MGAYRIFLRGGFLHEPIRFSTGKPLVASPFPGVLVAEYLLVPDRMFHLCAGATRVVCPADKHQLYQGRVVHQAGRVYAAGDADHPHHIQVT